MTETTAERGSATAPPAEVMAQLEVFRTELTGYCYRMLGSAFEAEDAVQETFVRAWRAYDQFEGRSSLRSWLYRIATNVCLSMLGASQRRARPMDLNPPQSADTPLPPPLSESVWIEPVPDSRVVPDGDPADVTSRESRYGSRSSPRSSTSRPGSGPSSSSARCFAGGRRRSRSCWAPRSHRSTARSSARGPRWPAARRRPRVTPSRSTTRAVHCWIATSTRSSATTWTRSPRCCTRTRRGTCRPTTSGWRRTATSSTGASAPGSAAVDPGCWRRWPTASRPSRSTSRAPMAATSRGRSRSSSSQAIGSPGSRSSSTRRASSRSSASRSPSTTSSSR